MIRVEKSRKRNAPKPWRVFRIRQCPYPGVCDMHAAGREHRTILSAFWEWHDAMRYARKVQRNFPKISE